MQHHFFENAYNFGKFLKLAIFFSLKNSRNQNQTLTFWHTLFKWITNESSWATANRIMTDNSAFSAKSTSSFTWISTLLIDASGLLITFTARYTFRSAIWRRTNKVWLTCACWTITNHTANTMASTWTRFAWILWQIRYAK